jgi:flagellum-specific peptidoglycan hydrolase FlgJ
MKHKANFQLSVIAMTMVLFLTGNLMGQSKGASEGPLSTNVQVVSARIASMYGADEKIVETYVQAAVNLENQTGISVAVVIAIAVHESSFNSELFINSHNPFGIEASKPWKGQTFSMVHDGRKTKFRVYSSAEEAVLDLGIFIKSRTWYADARACPIDDYPCVISGLKKTKSQRGYSMNPNWGDAVLAILKRYDLQALAIR